MIRLALLLTVFVASGEPVAPRPAPAGAALCREAGRDAGCFAAAPAARPFDVSSSACLDGWKAARKGGCWTEDTLRRGARLYVHPGGWVIEPACLEDGRFTAPELHGALSAAWKKLSPAVPVATGGCMAAFNPEWGRGLVEYLWANEVRVSCPKVEPDEKRCATHHRVQWTRDGRLIERSVVELRATARCSGKGGTGLAGTLFHETLHAAGADNLSTEDHNRAWELPQYKFVRDRVYGAEAVCFFGVQPAFRPLVNLLQCRGTVAYQADSPRYDLCRDFDASFHDGIPAGFLKH